MKIGAKRILVPVDGSETSERAFRWACQTARESKAELYAMYVIEVPLDLPLEAEMADHINQGEHLLTRIEHIGHQEKCKGVQAKYVRARDAGPAIVLETQDRDIGLVIMGMPYTRHFGGCEMGPTADYIFRNATCQVILWRDTSAPGHLSNGSHPDKNGPALAPPRPPRERRGEIGSGRRDPHG
jgi:nucleotide-binding universal stress UspA family protein